MHLVKMGTFTKMFSLMANNIIFFFFFREGGGSLSCRYKAGRGMKMQGEN